MRLLVRDQSHEEMDNIHQLTIKYPAECKWNQRRRDQKDDTKHAPTIV